MLTKYEKEEKKKIKIKNKYHLRIFFAPNVSEMFIDIFILDLYAKNKEIEIKSMNRLGKRDLPYAMKGYEKGYLFCLTIQCDEETIESIRHWISKIPIVLKCFIEEDLPF